MLTINDKIQIPDEELEFSFARSSGPGGQNVNKVNSKAVLRWQILESPSVPQEVKERFLEKYANRVSSNGELILSSQKYRDQSGNIENCLEKLEAMLLSVLLVQKPRRPTKPSLAARERRSQSKQLQSKKKEQRRSRPSFD